MNNYDLSKAFRKPDLAARLRKNGYKVQVTNGDGDKKEIVDEYFVTPEEVAAYDKNRQNFRVRN